MIAADKDDFSSRQKLRLLRVCSQLCPATAAVDLAIVFNCLLCVDLMLYDLLGDGNTKKKATLADLCCGSESPISKAQARIVEKLQAWGADGPSWRLLTCVGASPWDVRAAMMAKSELLLLSAALVDHFELRMSRPPYTLIRLLNPEISQVEQRRIVLEFLRAPVHCLSLLCRRLRELCPTMRPMLNLGRSVVQAWATNCFVGIDATGARMASFANICDLL